MKKNRFSSTTQVGIFSKKSIGQVDNHYYNFFLRNFEAVTLSWINVVQDNFSQVY